MPDDFTQCVAKHSFKSCNYQSICLPAVTTFVFISSSLYYSTVELICSWISRVGIRSNRFSEQFVNTIFVSSHVYTENPPPPPPKEPGLSWVPWTWNNWNICIRHHCHKPLYCTHHVEEGEPPEIFDVFDLQEYSSEVDDNDGCQDTLHTRIK